MRRPFSRSFSRTFDRVMKWPVIGTGLLQFFRDYNPVEVSTEYISNLIELPEGTVGAATITGGTFSVNGGAYGTTGTVAADDTVRLKATSSSEYETAVNVVFSVDAVEYDTWTITTGVENASFPYTFPFVLG